MQLRRLAGRTVVFATDHRGRHVTIDTSRDVRSLVPDPAAHVVLAVYDRSFTRRKATLTAHLASGRTATVTIPTG